MGVLTVHRKKIARESVQNNKKNAQKRTKLFLICFSKFVHQKMIKKQKKSISFLHSKLPRSANDDPRSIGKSTTPPAHSTRWWVTKRSPLRGYGVSTTAPAVRFSRLIQTTAIPCARALKTKPTPNAFKCLLAGFLTRPHKSPYPSSPKCSQSAHRRGRLALF